MRLVLIVGLLLLLAIAVLLLMRPRGPRITEIEHRREIDEDEDRDA